jgi:ABC-type branched-subunit amino acid transport system substrate-binding protein
MSGHRRRLQLVGVVAIMLVVAAACGQKPGVADNAAVGGLAGGTQLQLPEGTELDAEGNLIDSETGEIIATADELAENNPGLASGTGDGGSGTTGDPTGDTSDDPTGGGGGGSVGKPAVGDTTGITDTTIKIGIHAPITGAAPVPSQSFQKGKDLYWNYLKRTNNEIFGRTVETVFRNDNYNPSQAVSVCREMVEKEKVFLLVGVAGTDQIQACARYAASVGVPYLSAGVTEIGLDGLGNYFANWMTYPEQAPLLTDLLVTKLGASDEVNGMLRFNTPTFQDAHDAFIDAMEARGAEVAYDRAISKTAGASEAQTIATEMNQQGIDNVYVLTSPTFFIQLAQAAVNQQYKPQWTGVGLSMTLDTIANVACKNNGSIQNARFLGPFPAYVDSDKFDPQFRKEGGTDDIMFGLWASSKLFAEYMRKAGPDITREGFVSALEESTVKTGILPDVSFSPNDHFGGTAMHLLRADCPNNRWVTEQAFVKDFK